MRTFKRMPKIEPLDPRVLLSGGLAPSPRLVIPEDAGWKFKFAPSGAPQAIGFDDSSWGSVSLPHTWNAVDGASTGYQAGDGWYRKTITVDASLGGKELFLHFEGGSLATSLFVDGTQVDFRPSTPELDAHNGGFQTFDFDVTSQLKAMTPGAHLLAVKVNNATDANTAPAGSGDYSKQGGLYRDVSLIAVNPTHIALAENISHTDALGAATGSVTPISTNGLYFSNSPVVIGSPLAALTVRAVLDNLPSAARVVTVSEMLLDATGAVRSSAAGTVPLPAGGAGLSVTLKSNIANPHLWDGRIDPYLYTLRVELRDASTGELLDVQTQRVGIRSFRFVASPSTSDADATNDAPFYLNGHPYTLVGADMHQDSARPDASGNPMGWAQTDAAIQADVDLMANMGATALRTSHYQDNQAFYDYCDQVGILVYTESPINGNTNASAAFLTNAEDQYNELIRQNYNHPSVFAWGYFNETSDSTTARGIVSQLRNIKITLDPNRVSGVAQYGGSITTSANTEGMADIKGTHRYDYWYGQGSPLDQTHSAYPTQPLGITEAGGGGSAFQYAEGAIIAPPASVTTHFHPANLLSLIAETQLTDFRQYNYLWGIIVWQAFDMGSVGKNEGDQGGINDKGIATRDRTLKDDYYFYQASWNDPARNYANAKVLKISDAHWTARNSNTATVTVFSNLGAPTLTLNGVSLGTMSPLVVSGTNTVNVRTNEVVPNAYTFTLAGASALAVGSNALQVSATYAGQTYNDAATWSYYNAASFASATPLAHVAFGPSSATTPAGYVADSGAVYGMHANGASYGWLSTPGATFGSGSASDPSQAGIVVPYDPNYRTGATWEYALPNGTYDVRIGAGQTGTTDSVNNLSLEGRVAAIDTSGLNAQDIFFSRVVVTDGRLTLSATAGAYNAKLNFIDISTAASPVSPGPVMGPSPQAIEVPPAATTGDAPILPAPPFDERQAQPDHGQRLFGRKGRRSPNMFSDADPVLR